MFPPNNHANVLAPSLTAVLRPFPRSLACLLAGYYNHSQAQIQSQKKETSSDMQVLVTGTAGISWRKKPATVSGTVSRVQFHSLRVKR